MLEKRALGIVKVKSFFVIIFSLFKLFLMYLVLFLIDTNIKRLNIDIYTINIQKCPLSMPTLSNDFLLSGGKYRHNVFLIKILQIDNNKYTSKALIFNCLTSF